jgi:hypothetical protein
MSFMPWMLLAEKNSAPVPCAISLKIPALKSPALPMPIKSIIEILSHIDVGIAGQQRTALYEALFLSSKLFKGSHSKEKIAIINAKPRG